MIVLIILGALLAVGIVLMVIGDKAYSDAGFLTGTIMMVIFGAVTLVVVAFLICQYAGADAEKAKLEVRYESLSYQWEKDFYGTEYEIGKAELVKQIREWNEEMATMKKLQRNIWVGAIIPNIYDEFEFIPLEKGGKG